MERINLIYNREYRILICKVHQTALIPRSIELHLRSKHKYRGEQLHAALEEIQVIKPDLQLAESFEIVGSPIKAIPGVEVKKGIHCIIEEEHGVCDFQSVNKRLVERHQSRVHGVPDRRSKEWRREWSDREISKVILFQSIFPQPYYKPFPVWLEEEEEGGEVEEREEGEEEGSRAQVAPGVLDRLHADYKATQESIAEALGRIVDTPYKSQVPPWLSQLGISLYLSGLEKERIRQLKNYEHSKYFLYIKEGGANR